MDTLLTQLSSRNSNSYIFLDSNINLLKLANTPSFQLYHDTILDNGFLNLLHKATRIQGSNFSLIDQKLTNNNPSNTISGTLTEEISDHFINFTVIKKITLLKHSQTTKTRDFSNTNKDNFKTFFRSHNWETSWK